MEGKQRRNFWIIGHIDGRVLPLRVGPRKKSGGFKLAIYMYSRGQNVLVVDIEGKADGNQLLLYVDGHDPQYPSVSTGEITAHTTR